MNSPTRRTALIGACATVAMLLVKTEAVAADPTLELDPNMVRGDVHLSTPRGLLVRDLDSALDTIREQLLEELVR